MSDSGKESSKNYRARQKEEKVRLVSENETLKKRVGYLEDLLNLNNIPFV